MTRRTLAARLRAFRRKSRCRPAARRSPAARPARGPLSRAIRPCCRPERSTIGPGRRSTFQPAVLHYFVSVRAANGTAYATLPNSIKVGLPFEPMARASRSLPLHAERAQLVLLLWPMEFDRPAFYFSGQRAFLTGPPITGNYVPGQSTATAGDRFGITGTGIPLSEGVGTFEQLLTNAFGWPASFTDMTHDGVGNILMTGGNVTQTQTIGVRRRHGDDMVLGKQVLRRAVRRDYKRSPSTPPP